MDNPTHRNKCGRPTTLQIFQKCLIRQKIAGEHTATFQLRPDTIQLRNTIIHSFHNKLQAARGTTDKVTKPEKCAQSKPCRAVVSEQSVYHMTMLLDRGFCDIQNNTARHFAAPSRQPPKNLRSISQADPTRKETHALILTA